MPSFDVVSEVEKYELGNAVDQCNREISNRFDFKGTDSRIEQNDYDLVIHASSEFQVKQIIDIMINKMSKRGIDPSCLDYSDIVESNNEARMPVVIRHGIDKELAKKIIKDIKESRLKVQASIQGNQVRVTGKKRDDLQNIIALLKNSKYPVPLQYVNFRD